ncbi:MAG: ChbG/HpnK family deacetylase [Planctomycetes bacterium]|nr:ChbG/HpnK family deacetylase [Planctomycetota bacterium]
MTSTVIPWRFPSPPLPSSKSRSKRLLIQRGVTGEPAIPASVLSAPRRLIVNADDFGLSASVNAGIIRAHDDGILTSTTLLANGPAFQEAVALAAARPHLGVGIHLNLVRGLPLSSPAAIPALVNAAGRLRPFRLRRLTPAVLDQAEREYRRQFEAVLATGLRPTHVDFEKHHAWQGPLYALASRLAREYGVRAMRSLREPVWFALTCVGWPGLRGTVMAAALRCGVSLGGDDASGLARPDRLLGQTHIGRMTEAVWLALAAVVPPGTTEVMTHPGCSDHGTGESVMGGSWLGQARERELAALLSPSIRQALTDRNVSLIHFGHLVS